MSRSSYLKKGWFRMVWKFSFALCLLTMAGQLAMAQNAAGNILTGDVKAEVLKRYSGTGVLPKPDKVVIHDFATPAGAKTTVASIDGRLHWCIALTHGGDEDQPRDVMRSKVEAGCEETVGSEWT